MIGSGTFAALALLFGGTSASAQNELENARRFFGSIVLSTQTGIAACVDPGPTSFSVAGTFNPQTGNGSAMVSGSSGMFFIQNVSSGADTVIVSYFGSTSNGGVTGGGITQQTSYADALGRSQTVVDIDLSASACGERVDGESMTHPEVDKMRGRFILEATGSDVFTLTSDRRLASKKVNRSTVQDTRDGISMDLHSQQIFPSSASPAAVTGRFFLPRVSRDQFGDSFNGSIVVQSVGSGM
jgi:hypothetical protein